jgi:hypothetical protein
MTARQIMTFTGAAMVMAAVVMTAGGTAAPAGAAVAQGGTSARHRGTREAWPAPGSPGACR